MHSKMGAATRFGVLLLFGYLTYSWTIEYLPTRAAGLSKLAWPAYVRLLSTTNPIQWLAPPTPERPFSFAGFILLLCYLTICYIGVIRAASRKQASVALRPILGWIAAFSLPLLLAPEIFSADVYAYIMGGRVSVVHGANPTSVPPSAFPADPLLALMPGWRDTTAAYGPTWLSFSYVLTLLVHLFGQTPQWYVLVYKLAAIGLHMANTALIWRMLGRWHPERQAPGALLYGWNPLALMEFAGSAHNDALLIFFILLALSAAQQNRGRLATLEFTLSGLTKFSPLVLLPPYIVYVARQLESWKSRALVAGQAVGIAALSAALLYAPYWEGGRTLDALRAQPAVTGTVNSIGEWMALLLPRVTNAVTSQDSALSASGNPDNPADLPSQPETATGGPIFNLLVSRLGGVLLPILRLGANPWSGKVIFLLVWLWTCWSLWRQPSFDRLVTSCFWLLLTYSLSATMWFWPWYTTWPLALAALMDWRPAGRLMVVFTSLVWIFYLYQGNMRFILVYGPVFALIGWHLWCLSRKSITDARLRHGYPHV